MLKILIFRKLRAIKGNSARKGDNGWQNGWTVFDLLIRIIKYIMRVQAKWYTDELNVRYAIYNVIRCSVYCTLAYFVSYPTMARQRISTNYSGKVVSLIAIQPMRSQQTIMLQRMLTIAKSEARKMEATNCGQRMSKNCVDLLVLWPYNSTEGCRLMANCGFQ